MNPISLFPPPTTTISRNTTQTRHGAGGTASPRPGSSSSSGGRHGGGGGGHGQDGSSDGASSSVESTHAFPGGSFLKRTKSGGSGNGSGGEGDGAASARPGFRERLNSARLSLTPHIRRANSSAVLKDTRGGSAGASTSTGAESDASAASPSGAMAPPRERPSSQGGISASKPSAAAGVPIASNWEQVAAGSGARRRAASALASQPLVSPGTGTEDPSAELSTSPPPAPLLPGEEPSAEREAALALRALPNASYAFVPPPSARRHVVTTAGVPIPASANANATAQHEPRRKDSVASSSASGGRSYASSARHGGSSVGGGGDYPTSPKREQADPAAVHAATALFAATSGVNAGKGAGVKRLPMGLYFDYLRPDEVKVAHELEMKSFEHGDAAPLERFRYRHNRAPHLFLGAFLPTKMMNVDARHAAPTATLPGDLSTATATSTSSDEDGSAADGSASGKAGARSPTAAGTGTGTGTGAGDALKKEKRTLIGYICATAAGAYTARAITLHDDSEDAHLVCIHSICVGRIWRRRRIAKTMLEAFLQRIRDAELEGAASAATTAASAAARGPAPVIRKRGYETAAVIVHEEILPFVKACGFEVLGNSHVQYGSGDWIECRRTIVPARMKKTVAETWAIDDVAQQLQQREEERQWQEKKDAQRKEKVDAHVQEQAAAAGGSPRGEELKRSASPTQMTDLASSGTLAPIASHRSNTASSGSPTNSDAAGPASPSTSGTNSLSTSALLTALRQQTLSASQVAQRNPGQSYAAILGSALAGKTAHEDAFSALEARLVSRDLGTNLADIYCPRAECGCKVMGVDRGMWEVREIGPLSAPELDLPNSPAPPMHPSPPQPPAQARVSTANGPAQPITPGQAFWVVPTPLAFDNISFSRDAKWKPVLGAQVTSPRAEDHHFSTVAAGSKEEKRELKERERREKAERKATMKAAKRQNSMPFGQSVSPPRADSPQRSGSPIPEHAEENDADRPEFTVKYLLCAECDCGPLGYSILPQSLTGGGLAQQVGQDLNGGGGGDRPEPPRQEFLIAADRVRYRFPRQ